MSSTTDDDPGFSELRWDRMIALVSTKYEGIRIGHPALKPVYDAFVWNFQRTREMALVMSQVGHVGQRMQRAYDLALLEITGTLDEIDDPKVLALANTKLRRFILAEAELAKTNNEEWQVHLRDMIDNGTRCVELFDTQGGKRALNEFFASCLISTWTTFETTAGDLWEAALNAHPRGLSELKGTKKPKSSGRDELEGDRKGKEIALDWLHRYQFDLRDRMGTVLRSRHRFDRLSGLRLAYLQAFEKDSARLEEILNRDAIDALNSVRNLLVHKAGIADSEYERRSSSWAIPKAAIGERISLDGDIVYGLIEPVSMATLELLAEVDRWIATN